MIDGYDCRYHGTGGMDSMKLLHRDSKPIDSSVYGELFGRYGRMTHRRTDLVQESNFDKKMDEEFENVTR
ncbi:hypothetical protein KY328_00645 [Candidatus Woesearchaeota archaeon]|nr:hypothetical protein [Candidatus Woesearchaeota archaeon]MBW3021405.1 hypothetical protein [Candidatus Woesearchaeota archaeon]